MSIPGSAEPLLLAQQDTGGYQIQRSLRFSSSDSAYLSRTPASAGNRKTWSLSFWIKFNVNSGNQYIFAASPDGYTSDFHLAYLRSDGTIKWDDVVGGSNVQLNKISNQVFRDFSAWYHFLFVVDTTNGTAANRNRLYVNGSEITWASGNNFTSNADSSISRACVHHIGGLNQSSSYLSAYLADVHFIDGQALTPSSFTEVSATTGQLIPKAYTGSFGTNGFWLKFSDNSAATATTLGKDYSGNNNNWSPSNLSVQVGLNYSSNVTTVATSFYNGTPATMFDGSTSTYYGVTSNNGSNSSISIDLTGKGVSVSTGIRVYGTYRNGMVWQINGSTVSSSGVSHPNTGWQTLSGWSSGSITSISVSVPSGSANEIYAIEVNGAILTNSSGAGNDSLVDTPTSYGTDTGAGGEVRGNYCTWNPLVYSSGLSNGNLDVAANQARGTQNVFDYQCYWEITSTGGNTDAGVQKADGTSNTITIASGKTYGFRTGSRSVQYINITDAGSWTTWLTSANVGSTEPYFPYVSGGAGATSILNAGQRAFAATAPSGYKALCDTNLPAPVVAKSSDYFQTVLYTGNGSTQKITTAFSPDLVWIKSRGIAYWHRLNDSVRGVQKFLYSNATDAEGTSTTNDKFNSFDSDGFTLGSATDTGADGMNQNGLSYVAWAWDAGSSTVTNTQGSITSQVRASASSGFSIVSYTAAYTGSARTVGHGLGVKPNLIILKNRNDGSANWRVYHSASGASLPLILNSTAAAASNFGIWDNTEPTSSVFTVGINTDVGGNIGSGDNLIAYCFAPVAGLSAMGSYVGNGSATDGPFVFCNFRPRWLLLKNTSQVTNWYLVDSARNTYNVVNSLLRPNLSNAELSGVVPVDFLSNGFKVRDNDAGSNANGDTIVWAAFAENPFQYARAR